MQTRRIQLTFPDTGESVLAEAKALHGMYSGTEVFVLVDNPEPAPAENLVQLPLPGELLYFFDEGRGAVGARKAVGEICLVDMSRYRCRPACSPEFRATGSMTGPVLRLRIERA